MNAEAVYISLELWGAVLPDKWYSAANEAEKLADELDEICARALVATRRIENMDDDRPPWWKAAQRQITGMRSDVSFSRLVQSINDI